MLSFRHGGEIGFKKVFQDVEGDVFVCFGGGGMLLFDPLKRKVKNMPHVCLLFFCVDSKFKEISS